MTSICLIRLPIGGLGEPNIYHDLGVFYKEVGRFPQQNTKYAEHYTSYGYSFRIYGDFE